MANAIYNHICLYCEQKFVTNDKNKKFCNLSCSTANKNKVAREKNINQYNLDPNHCYHCNSTLSFDNRKNKFCSQSCAASFNNNKRDYTTFKPGPKPGTITNKKVTKIKQCVICGKFHPRLGRTCSHECKSTLLSIVTKERIYNGWNPNPNRSRGKRSWLEKSFKEWVTTHYPTTVFETERSFKRLDCTKTYFADFYFPELNLIIELDGTQHLKTTEYDLERDAYITNTYGIEVIRISHKEYQNKSKLELVKQKLSNTQ